MKYPQPIDPLYTSAIHSADGSDYNDLFRGEGERQKIIHDCCQEINQLRSDKRKGDQVYRKKQKAHRICKKYNLDEKLIFNILKI